MSAAENSDAGSIHVGRSVDSRELRNALGCFATGVAVVTALTEDGERLGMTVNSFNSVSLDPPLVLFSVARSSLAIRQWLSVKQFAICLLSEEQRDISNRFAKAGMDKWVRIRTCAAATIDAPLLSNALAWFECELHGRHDGGDHVIVVGHVLSVGVAQCAAGKALIFYRGRYAGLCSEADTVQDIGPALLGW